jgi:protein MpaA
LNHWKNAIMNRFQRTAAFVGALAFAATVHAAPLEAQAHTSSTVGETVNKRPIKCDVYGKGDDVLWIIATIHGNEAAGTPLVAKFVEWLKAHPKELDGRTVVITPVANPDGMADNVRYNKHGVDLNRNFPAGNWNTAGEKAPGQTPLSEPESRSLMRVLCQFFPNRIVSIHQPLTCLEYDGPAEGLAKAMGAKCKLPVKKLGSRPGSLGSFVGVTLGKPIVTMELPENAGMDGDKLWKEYGEALIAALRYKEPEAKK